MNAIVWFMYAFFVLGGAGVYLLMPRAGTRTQMAGAIVGLGGLAGVLVLMLQWSVPHSYNALFYTSALVAVVAGARVVTHPKPVYSAVYFVLVVVAVAVLMVIQLAEFLAIALIIIYAGAILVTYVFVIMLAQQSSGAGYDLRAREPLGAVMASFVLAAAVAGQVGQLQSHAVENSTQPQLAADVPPEPAVELAGNTTNVGAMLLTQYVVALELAGVLLLVAMVGSITLARRKTPVEVMAAVPEVPLGEVGKRVKPF